MTPKHFHVAFSLLLGLRSSGPPAVSVTSSISQPGNFTPAFPTDHLLLFPRCPPTGPGFHLLICEPWCLDRAISKTSSAMRCDPQITELWDPPELTETHMQDGICVAQRESSRLREHLAVRVPSQHVRPGRKLEEGRCRSTTAVALASPGLQHTQKQNQAEPASRADRAARPSEVAVLPRPPHQAANGADEVDPGGVGGAPLVAGGAGRAVDVLQEQAAAVLHHGARLRHPQVADGDGLRERAL